MKKLILVRHAKSLWEENYEDNDRPLKKIGVDRAYQHADLLSECLDVVPEYWASSYATRALQTAVIFASKFNHINNLNIQKELYTFDEIELKNTIQKIPAVIDSAILFGHNNAILDFLNKYTDTAFTDFKTAACAEIEFNHNRWEDIENGRITNFITKNQIL